MSTTVTKELIPGQPVPLDRPIVHAHDEVYEEKRYLLHYRHGNNMNWKFFDYSGSFRQAMQRAQKHCMLMNYRFIILRPAVSNLEDDEKNREQGISS